MQQISHVWLGSNSIFSSLVRKNHLTSLISLVPYLLRSVKLDRIPMQSLQPYEDCWHVAVTKDFDCPQYHIGQVAWHVMKVPQGQILHPVTITGFYWTGVDWEYHAELPTNHPYFEDEDCTSKWLDDWQLESL